MTNPEALYILAPMDEKTNDLDFEVLGFKIKLRPGEEGRISPSEAVSLVREEADNILKRSPHLEAGGVAVLVALKMAYSKLEMEGEYRRSIETLHTTAGNALEYIEDISPSLS